MTATALNPTVGTGATVFFGSDRVAGTVIHATKSQVVVQEDISTPAEGFDYFGNQVYDYLPDNEGRTFIFTLRDNGAWVAKGSGKRNGLQAGLGGRNTYRDPHF